VRGSAPLGHLEFFGTHRRLCDCVPNQYIHRTWFYDHFTHLAADTRDAKIELIKGMKVGVEDFVRESRAHGDKERVCHGAKFDPDFAQQQISTTSNDGMDLPNQNLHQFPLQHRKAVAEILSCTWMWCCVVSCRRSPC